MVGIKKVVAIIGIIIPFFAIFLMSQNVSALRVDNSYNQFYYSTDGITQQNHTYQWSSPKVVMNNQPCGSDCYLTGATLIQAIQVSYENLTPQGNHLTIHFEMNLRSQRTSASLPLSNLHPYLDNVNIGSVVFYPNNGNGVVLNRETTSLSYAITPFTANGGYKAETITFYGDITVSGVPTGTAGAFRINMSASPNYILGLPNDVSTITFIEQNPTSFIYSNNLNDALLSQQIAQNEVLIQLQTEQQAQENEAYDNISSQIPSDISNATDEETTNIIGVITNFISVITGLNTSNTNCNLTLPFPEFTGGSRTVNICSGKNYWSGQSIIGGNNFFAIIGRLMLICFFVPICFVLLKMIYNEIRSWTSG